VYCLSEQYLDWLKGAEETLEVVNLLFKHGKYRFAIFHLQQAAEITSKAMLMRADLLLTSEENDFIKEMRENFHLPQMSAKDYSHDWHIRLIKIIDGFVDKMDALSKDVISANIFEQRITTEFVRFSGDVPDYKERITNARSFKLDLNPSIQELNDTILFCHSRIDLSFKAYRDFNPKKFKMPNKKRFIKKVETGIGQKIDDPTLKLIDNLWTIELKDFRRRMIVFSQTLMILAIVNSYLLPHEQRSRYPFAESGLTYHSGMPLVLRIKDFCEIIRRCIWICQGKQGFNSNYINTITLGG
jgi:hypothetical protein